MTTREFHYPSSHLEHDLIDAALAADAELSPVDVITRLEAIRLRSAIPVLARDSETLGYQSSKALSYVRRWCGSTNDCPKGRYREPEGTDCTHFIAHAEYAAGVRFENFDAVCPTGVPIRVIAYAASFANAARKFSNVHRLAGWRDTRRGDYCFVTSWFGRKSHVMMLNARASRNGASVFGHDTDRCGTFVEFDVDDCKFYRIEDT